MRRSVVLIAIAIVVFMLTTAESCSQSKQEKQREQAVNQRAAVYDQAKAEVPTPTVLHFPRRQTLADAVTRQSLLNHPWYVYVTGLNGNIVYYFVAKSVPVNDCDYLSSTENVDTTNNVVLSAPSLEGIFQSGSGCDTLTFFDLTTNAEIQIARQSAIILDRPLKVQAEPIKVAAQK